MLIELKGFKLFIGDDKDMTKLDEMIKIIQAYRDGETVEYLTGQPHYNVWTKVTDKHAWNFSGKIYRIAPSVPDSIDWSHVADEYKYMARDEDGEAWLYTGKPDIDFNSWEYIWSPAIEARVFKSYKRGTTDWRESLVERPS